MKGGKLYNLVISSRDGVFLGPRNSAGYIYEKEAHAISDGLFQLFLVKYDGYKFSI